VGAGCSEPSWASPVLPASPPASRPGNARCAGCCPKRTIYDVACELGPAEVERTIVLIAHHDAAYSGLVHNGTDGLEPLAAGYETAALCACNELKQPAFYHWPNDVAANVDFATVADAIRLVEAAIRRLDERWL
jgi:hypothetical protein